MECHTLGHLVGSRNSLLLTLLGVQRLPSEPLIEEGSGSLPPQLTPISSELFCPRKWDHLSQGLWNQDHLHPCGHGLAANTRLLVSFGWCVFDTTLRPLPVWGACWQLWSLSNNQQALTLEPLVPRCDAELCGFFFFFFSF